MDNHDVGRARSINWEEEDMTKGLIEHLSGLKPGDHVTTTGVDTRGHQVTRTGVLLWEPKQISAQRNGIRTKAWRVFVGAPGTDPTNRRTWVTLFNDSGTVAKEENGPLTAINFMEAIHGQVPEIREERPRLVVIACGGKKSPTRGVLPAAERYIGNYHTACRMAAEVMPGPTMILSAQFGLLSLDDDIEDYNLTFGDPEAITAAEVKDQAAEMGLLDAQVTVLGGRQYVEVVRSVWPDAEAPLTGGIGQQLKQLAGIYDGEALDDDEHQDQEPAEKPEGPNEWRSGAFREIPGLPDRHRNHGLVVWFGGKAGARHPQPSKWTKVKIIYTGEGRYDLYDLATDEAEAIITCTLATKVHWAPGTGAVLDEGQRPRPSQGEPEAAFEVPVNYLELAREGNTPQARAYWTRRCDEYRRTGK